MTHGPFLWYLNRGTGIVLLGMLTLTVLLGVRSLRSHRSRGLPRFLTQSLHRDLSLISLALLGAHVASAVVDEYVDIRWWQALVPWGATYKPLWLELGTVALDLVVVLVVTSLLRRRLGHRCWRVLHTAAYGCWALALVHGLGVGTDTRAGWGRWSAVACAGLVALAVLGRIAGLLVSRRAGPRVDESGSAEPVALELR
jgi:sulfoxide reductase heme-binding subunit YedZ